MARGAAGLAGEAALAERYQSRGRWRPKGASWRRGRPLHGTQVAAEPGRYAPGKGALAALVSAAAVAARRETPAAAGCCCGCCGVGGFCGEAGIGCDQRLPSRWLANGRRRWEGGGGRLSLDVGGGRATADHHVRARRRRGAEGAEGAEGVGRYAGTGLGRYELDDRRSGEGCRTTGGGGRAGAGNSRLRRAEPKQGRRRRPGRILCGPAQSSPSVARCQGRLRLPEVAPAVALNGSSSALAGLLSSLAILKTCASQTDWQRAERPSKGHQPSRCLNALTAVVYYPTRHGLLAS